MRAKRGAVLLEAVVALAILSVSAPALLLLLREQGVREAQGQREEGASRAAERVLIAMTLLTRRDLDQRLGTRSVGEFGIAVERTRHALYRITVAEATHPARPLLVTVVYRPESAEP